jgi:outer membrane PBP1 activator LpoA protein
MKIRGFLLLLVFVFVNCSGVSVGTGPDKSKMQQEDQYSPSFIGKLNIIKQLYSQGKDQEALKNISSWDEKTLSKQEKSLKSNFHGVIFYRMQRIDEAVKKFNQALSLSAGNSVLDSQININLASISYKKGQTDKARSYLTKVEAQNLSEEESYKYYYLRYYLIQGSKTDSLFSLVKYLGKYKQFQNLKNDSFFTNMVSEFSALDSEMKMNFLYQFQDQKNLAVVYLSGLEAEKKFFAGDKSQSLSMLNWVKNHFIYDEESKKLVEATSDRIENFSKINLKAVGVVLPLSGKKRDYARRVLLGIDTFYKKPQAGSASNPILPTIYTKDSKGDGTVGSFAVRDLAKVESVAVIIGGLFSDEAQKEYLEAKKNGIFFISLSPVYLPESEKDYLLLEVPGSVESQIAKVFEEANLNYLGKKAGLLYSDDERGHCYMKYFAKMAALKGVKITAAQSYAKDSVDFRPYIEKFLSLKYVRERQEEYDLLVKAKANGKDGKKTQILPPIVDFDFVFIPAYPDEAVRLIPTFKYYDVNKMNYIGIPSWRSTSLERISQRIPLHFVGDDMKQLENDFKDFFFARNAEWPGVVEITAYSASKVAMEIMKDLQNTESRSEFLQKIQVKNHIEDGFGGWTLSNNLWLRNMKLLKFSNAEIQTLN